MGAFEATSTLSVPDALSETDEMDTSLSSLSMFLYVQTAQPLRPALVENALHPDLVERYLTAVDKFGHRRASLFSAGHVKHLPAG